MAKRKKTFKKSRKNQKRFKRAKAGASLLTNSQGIILPQRFRTRLTYNERLVTSGSGQLHIVDLYRTNNVYDPAAKGGNYGCNGFRQLATMYDKYICYGSKIEVNAMSNTDVTVQNITVVPTTTSIAFNDIINNVDGMRYAKHGKMMSIANGGSPESKVKNSITVQELYGLRKNEAKYDPSLRMKTDGNVVNGVPFKDGYWNIIIRNADIDTPANLNVALNVKITYDIEFFDRSVLLGPTVLEQESLELDTARGAPIYTVLGATGGTGGIGPFVTNGETGTTGSVIAYGTY